MEKTGILSSSLLHYAISNEPTDGLYISHQQAVEGIRHAVCLLEGPPCHEYFDIPTWVVIRDHYRWSGYLNRQMVDVAEAIYSRIELKRLIYNHPQHPGSIYDEAFGALAGSIVDNDYLFHLGKTKDILQVHRDKNLYAMAQLATIYRIGLKRYMDKHRQLVLSTERKTIRVV